MATTRTDDSDSHRNDSSNDRQRTYWLPPTRYNADSLGKPKTDTFGRRNEQSPRTYLGDEHRATYPPKHPRFLPVSSVRGQCFFLLHIPDTTSISSAACATIYLKSKMHPNDSIPHRTSKHDRGNAEKCPPRTISANRWPTSGIGLGRACISPQSSPCMDADMRLGDFQPVGALRRISIDFPDEQFV